MLCVVGGGGVVAAGGLRRREVEGWREETKVFLLCKMRKDGQTNTKEKYMYIEKTDNGIKRMD